MCCRDSGSEQVIRLGRCRLLRLQTSPRIGEHPRCVQVTRRHRVSDEVADVADGRGKTDVADSSTGRLEQRIAELEAENVRLSEALQAASRRCPRREHDDARDSKQQLHLILDSATDYAVLTTDLERRVTSWSAGAEATLGYAAHEIVGRSGDVLFTPEDQSAGIPKQEAETARRDGLAPDGRWHQRRDGSRVFFDGSTRLLRDRDGREVGFLKVVRDGTERRRSDEALQVAGERAAAEAAEREAILGQLAEGVIVTDAKGCITFVNEAAERLHGVKMLGVGPETYTEAYHLLTEAGDPYPPHDLPLARAALLVLCRVFPGLIGIVAARTRVAEAALRRTGLEVACR